MKRRTRIILLIFGLLVFLGIATGTVLLGPRVGATRTLVTFAWKVPDDLESLEKAPAGYVLLEASSVPGLEHVFLRREDDGARHPTIVLVHGVAAVGLRDGRLRRAIEAFHRGGFTVVAPELGPLVDPTRPAAELAGLDRLLDAVAAGEIPGADGRKFGLVGISVGGAVALRAAAAFRARGGQGLRAVLAIGAPDDLRVPAEDWFSLPNAASEGVHDFFWERQHAAAFARNFVARAALGTRVQDPADIRALRDWLAADELPKEPAPALVSDSAKALAALLLAAPEERAREGAALLKDAWAQLRPLSPADWDEALSDLRGVAVFLLHGEEDPLVPVGQVELLAERLRKHTLVTVLRSRLLGHTAIGDGSFGEWADHILFLDDFFDMLGG